MRVVSLLPSATEIVCALGARDELVGRSHECDWPTDVRDVPVMTRARLPALGSSRAIDALARERLADATSIYEIDTAKLEAASPDVIATQELARFSQRDARVVNLGPLRLADVWSDIKRVADAIGRHEAGVALVQRLEARVEEIAAFTAAAEHSPKVLTVCWLDPMMIGGLWLPELVTLAGGAPLAASLGAHARVVDARALAELDPDVVLVAPVGFGVERTLAELHVAQLPSHWRAVREGHVYVADGSAFFNRAGPRLVESLEILARCIHPRSSQILNALAGTVAATRITKRIGAATARATPVNASLRSR